MEGIIYVIFIAVVAIGAGVLFMFATCYKKVEQGTAIIRNGMGGTKVSFVGMLVFPIFHRRELMDISVKRVEIDRTGTVGEGLICRDNLRADVKVAFFVRVNKTPQDVLKVAQSLGCKRGSDPQGLIEFFDAKFSEGLKTVGKQFDFVDLYTNRELFKEEILKVIGTDLNGYILDDAAIDYLEQTSLSALDPKNILDAEGIKKITELTAAQNILSNDISRNEEKTIKKQDVEAREAILELERQQADAEQKQLREIAEITAREEAQSKVVQEEERLRSEKVRIKTAEEVAVAEENRERQIIVALKNKERTEAVEVERVERDRGLERVERERLVTLKDIDKEKAVEVEKKNIQEVIRERVSVERTVVEEEEKIKDTKEFATAERARQVAETHAEEEGRALKIKAVLDAEAQRDSAKHIAEERVINAQAERDASEREADARKILADAKAQEEAVIGMGEARVLEAKAEATEKFGRAEATVIGEKAFAEADGIEKKAEAMKLFDGVGREHEEFKLQLNKDLELQLASVNVQRDIAKEQASLIGEALKSANIDIVGGDSDFFDKIVNSVSKGKALDSFMNNSALATDVANTLFSGDPEAFTNQLRTFAGRFGMSSEDLKNITVSALLTKMTAQADDNDTLETLGRLSEVSKQLGIGAKQVTDLMQK
ncbi:flotillin family protein [Kiritimatiellaeota bacterium B1221]|nr:flotillin family protein [Kiritimatiellaeota bacterium B1221]